MRASELAFWSYLALLAAVGAGRLLEMRISRRHQRALAARWAGRAADPGFPAMVALHTGVLVASAVEVVALERPFIPALAAPAFVVFVLANVLRWWVIATLGLHWNVQVMGSLSLGVVTSGPYRFVRHPNYVAVFVELLALPLVHTAWITALVGAGLHAAVLRSRLRAEEAVLSSDEVYRAAMGGKPRFIPSWGRARSQPTPSSASTPTWPTS